MKKCVNSEISEACVELRMTFKIMVMKNNKQIVEV